MAGSARTESQTDPTQPLGLAREDPTHPAHAYHPTYLLSTIFLPLLPRSSQRQVDKITPPKSELLPLQELASEPCCVDRGVPSRQCLSHIQSGSRLFTHDLWSEFQSLFPSSFWSKTGRVKLTTAPCAAEQHGAHTALQLFLGPWSPLLTNSPSSRLPHDASCLLESDHFKKHMRAESDSIHFL